jgi:heme oxygenase (biliverdin-IX-beta and delta-forming)
MILKNIKARTTNSHLRVEQSKLMQPLGNGTLSAENYGLILRKFYGFFNPLEKAISGVEGITEVLPDFPQRRKSSLLLQDLKALREQGQVSSGLPFCPSLPEVSTLSQAMGCLYVMEGSTLGGRFIARQVQESLGLDPETGGAFFHGYGAATGRRWKGFQEALRAYSENTGNEAAIIEAAEETFSQLEKWLNLK